MNAHDHLKEQRFEQLRLEQQKQSLEQQEKILKQEEKIKREKEIKITLIVRQITLLEQILELLKNYFSPSKQKFEVLEHLEEEEETKKSEIFEDLFLDDDIINDE